MAKNEDYICLKPKVSKKLLTLRIINTLKSEYDQS